MRTTDLLRLAGANLWRQKLRVALTLLGVIIAITTFVTMLAFGTGMKRSLQQQAETTGMFHRVNVRAMRPQASPSPARQASQHAETEADSLATTDEDSTAPSRTAITPSLLTRMEGWPQVRFAYPYQPINISLRLPGDSLGHSSSAQAMPTRAQSEHHLRLEAGEFFGDADSQRVLLRGELLEELGVEDPDSLVGQILLIETRSASLDSAMAGLVEALGPVGATLRQLRPDSLLDRNYLRRQLRARMGAAMGGFIENYFSQLEVRRDSVLVAGVLKQTHGFDRALQPVLLPPALAGRLREGLQPTEPTEMMEALRSGALFERGEAADSGNYSRATLYLTDPAFAGAVVDSVEALGLNGWSFSLEFEQISRVFALMNLGLGLIGFIAMFVAALGIVNTLVMAIIERRQEIGVLKSLGAEEGEIRALFLAESAVIGLLGSLLGLLLGWVVIRVGVLVGTAWLAAQGASGLEMLRFGLTPSLSALALAFGLVVSLLAGLYPAARAAQVDPVQALRGE